MKCEFCSVHTFNGSNYRLRSVDRAVDDFAAIKQDLVYIVDDNFVGYSKKARDHAMKFFKGVVRSGVKKQWGGSASMNIADDEEVLEWAAKSGCKLVFLGIESERIDQLEQMGKNVNLKIGVDHYQDVYDKIHKHQIAVMGAFIYGLDNDTPETIYNRTSYILSADIDIMQASILTPLPGTLLFKRMQEEGRLIHDDFPGDWKKYNYAEVVYQPQKMSIAEFENTVLENWERLYNLKTLQSKFLKTVKKTKDSAAASWAITSNLQLRNFVFEGRKDFMDIKETFPTLFNNN